MLNSYLPLNKMQKKILFCILFLKEMYYLCDIDEMPRKHIKAEYSNKNGWQLITSKSGNLPKFLIIKG